MCGRVGLVRRYQVGDTRISDNEGARTQKRTAVHDNSNHEKPVGNQDYVVVIKDSEGPEISVPTIFTRKPSRCNANQRTKNIAR